MVTLRVFERRVDRVRMRGTIVLLAALIAGCGESSAAPGSDGVTSLTSPGEAIATPMDGPTIIDVPSTLVASQQVDAAGALIEVDGVSLAVPPGALAADTLVEVVRLDAPFEMNPYADDAPGQLAVAPAGAIFDFGPAGLSFDRPVEISLPFDPQPVEDGFDQPAVVYWTGSGWSLITGEVDTAAQTVTVDLSSFDGIALTPVQTTVEALEDLVGGAADAGKRFSKWIAGSDPVKDGDAGDYITPDDPAVVAAAEVANIGGVLLEDEANLAAYLGDLEGGDARISIPDADGNQRHFSYTAGTGSNWQKPADHLASDPTGSNYDGAPALGSLRGDCTDVTNTMASIFRSLGYPAKGVFGYAGDKNSPHAWVEVVIGGKPYIVHENGAIQDLERGFSAGQLIRPDPLLDNRAAEWDETGQRPYEEEWWTKWAAKSLAGVWDGTITWTGYEVPALVEGQLRCTSSDGLPLTVALTMTLQDLGDGRYFARYHRGGVTCWAYEPDDPIHDSYWESPGPPGSDGKPINDAGDYGLEMTLSGTALAGTDPLGVTFSGLVSPTSTSISGTITRSSSTGGVLSGTWTVTLGADS